MDITSLVSKLRSDALSLGDYQAYRSSCSTRIAKLRKRSGRATARNKKSTPKPPITAEDVANNAQIVHLIIYCAERAWAHAMLLKTNSANSGRAAPSNDLRAHIVSRVHKAYLHATELLTLLQNPESKATNIDVLEARAYQESLAGTEAFEKKHWEDSLNHLAITRALYASLQKKATTDSAEAFKDMLSLTIDPGVRYSAYQLQLPRSVDIAAIARQKFPREDEELLKLLSDVDPEALADPGVTKTAGGVAAVTSVTWRGRTANIEDADVALSLANVQLAAEKVTTDNANPDEFDDVLACWQECVDATKKAIDNSVSEGVAAGDEKLQALQLTYTYVCYNLISWRIRRNTVMANSLATKDRDLDGEKKTRALHDEVALWDAILQSLEQATSLPGVAADDDFCSELEGKRLYFLALKVSTIARSYPYNSVEALALYSQAFSHAKDCLPLIPTDADNRTEIQSLHDSLKATLTRTHALTELEKLREKKKQTENDAPLVERLESYPISGVDFKNLVRWPPALQPCPVKPVFFDVAWNYLGYRDADGKEIGDDSRMAVDSKGAADSAPAPAREEKKSGLFGFWGR